MKDTYSHGHHASVLRSHAWRTVENSAGYLLPELRSGMRLLDVGCGPGTITIDLAERVAPGEVLAIDAEAGVLEQAQAAADERGVPGTLRFAEGDAYDLRRFGLDITDDTFDVVHAHQVLQHLTDPVAALTEFRRVLKPSGIVAVRDSDYSACILSPLTPGLVRWGELIHDLGASLGAQPDAGRFLPAWVRAAGFSDLRVSSSTWTYADEEHRRWWGDLWAERTLASSFADLVVERGLSDRDELDRVSAAWRAWTEEPDGVAVIVAVEVLGRA